MLSSVETLELEKLLYENDIEVSRSDFLKFTSTTFSKFNPSWFHKKYYNILQLFADKKIKNLIISMPPQHGKSEGSSRRLPAYIAGKRPDDRIALVSYSATKSQKFGREIMSIMREKEYKNIFPEVKYPERGYTGTKSNTNENRESINSRGSMKFVGVSGGLTGDSVDVLILDDLYKDWQEANSQTIQKKVWDWYISVADSRLNNDSQQLIVFTRWSENDLIAILEEKGKIIEWNEGESVDILIDKMEHDEFLKINFPAIKESDPTELDPRKKGEPLWPENHSLRKLISSREKDSDKFDCLYQGDPVSKEGLLYSQFKTYTELPSFKIIKNRTDTADTGKDNLCSISYGVPLSKTDDHLYVIDLVYTDEPMEKTEPKTADLLVRTDTRKAIIESNNGGRGFARNVEAITKKITKNITYKWFHQSGNKESRIYSNSASVNRLIVFPDDWHIRWPEFYKAVTKYKKEFSTNKFDDAPDVLTGIIEEEEKKAVKITRSKVG